MKKLIKMVVLAVVTCSLATPALAKKRVKIKVKNCSTKTKIPSGYKYKITVCVYNGADKSKSTARHRKTLIPGYTWSTHCNGKNWAGQNTHRCKVYFTTGGQACPVDVGKKAKRVPMNNTFYVSYTTDGKKIQGKLGSKSICAGN